MPQKTFNIGEYSYYGRWKIEIKGEAIVVTGMDWYTRKVRQTDTFTKDDANNNRLWNHLESISTVHWADKMMAFVHKHVPKKEVGFHAW